MLSVEGLQVRYGDVPALFDIDLTVGDGEVVSVVGPNGAGKTTLLCTVSGLLRPTAGTVSLNGHDLTGARPDRMVAAGVGHVPEGRHLFGDMSVEENLLVGGISCTDRGERRRRLQQVFDRFPRLADRARQSARTLSGGEGQMLAIGRALMARPRLLMLDEPSQGLAPVVVDDLFALLDELSADGITILLVEQNVDWSLDLSDRAYVLETGRVLAAGPADELARDPSFADTYLGA